MIMPKNERYRFCFPIWVMLLWSTRFLFAQEIPSTWHISEDTRNLKIGGEPSKGFYNDTKIKQIKLYFYDNNLWDSLIHFVPVKMVYEGIVYDSVGISFRGNSSDYRNKTKKKSFNIDLDFTKDYRIEGYKSLNLNCGYEDPSNVKEIIYNNIGRNYLPALATNFVQLFINDVNWGIYTNVQQLDRAFLDEWFLDSDGPRWRCEPKNDERVRGENMNVKCAGLGFTDGFGALGARSSLNWYGPDSTTYQNNYTLKGKSKGDDWQKLINCLDKLNNLPADLLETELPQYFDIDMALWFLAHENIFSDEDSYIYKGKNDYFVYYNNSKKQLIPLTYDGNSILEGKNLDWPILMKKDVECYPLMHKLMSVPAYKARYLSHCRYIVKNFFDPIFINEKIDHYTNMIDTFEQKDTIGSQLYSYDRFKTNTSVLKEAFAVRRNFLLQDQGLDQKEINIGKVYHAIRGITNTNASPSDSVLVYCTVEDREMAVINLYYSTSLDGPFTLLSMNDNGVNGDKKAGDLVYSRMIPPQKPGSFIKYYVEAVGKSGLRSYQPAGAEHDVYFYKVDHLEIPLSPIVVNEFMASNDSTVFDAEGKSEDWIEFYNRADQEIDISGYFLTNKLNKKYKWVFPSGTKVAAREYLIVWADNDIDQPGLHANFTLSKDGGCIGMYDRDTTLIDFISYPKQEKNLAMARLKYDEGFFDKKIPTFFSDNDNKDAPSRIILQNHDFSIFPNPAYDSLQIETSINELVKAEIIDQKGRIILERKFRNKTVLYLKELHRGAYQLKINGKEEKLIKL